MHFKITQEMKQKIIVYSTSLIIAILFFTILNKFKDIKQAIQFIITILFPFLLGIGIAFILNNPEKWVENKLLKNVPLQKNHKRILATLIVFILAIGFLILFFSIIIPNTVDSVRQFSTNIAVYSDTFISYTKDFAYRMNISEKQVEQMLINFDITSIVTESIPKIASYSYSFVKGFINLILAFVSAFYILLDRETLVKGIKKLNYSLFDKNFANYLTLWTNDAKTVFEQYIVGNIIDSFIVGVLCYVVILFLKIPYTNMIALIIGVTNVIPVFGPFLGAIPVIIILCLIDPLSALIFAIVIFIIQQIDGNIIKPIVLGDKLGMSGFWILFSVTVGGALFGVVGMFLGVPIFALIYAGIHDYITVRLRHKKITVNDKAGTID
ncbi:AI-2E family transporter [Holdemanella biformis]|uniref:AI-2E family transporter n=1 Tax=Holdemanella biformis TaxID=1735 RepID=UPI001C2604DB|nr:AI-2E family transporter [Holdemanella biformis]MBU9896172.1 AI-2E family transporter [Holdemanella biformis]MBV3417244.1 AI-2E family transporter [Holdemanella biformis]